MSKEYEGYLRAFVNNTAQWDAFTKFIDDEIESQNRKLHQSSDMLDVYRAQGAIHQLQRLSQMKGMFQQ